MTERPIIERPLRDQPRRDQASSDQPSRDPASREPATPPRTPGSFLVRAAAIVVIVAGIKAAAEVLVPVLLASFVALAVSPLLVRAGRPTSRARLFLVVMIVLGLLVALVWGGERAVSHSGDALSRYADDIRGHQLDLAHMLRRSGLYSFARTVETSRIGTVTESILTSSIEALPAMAAGLALVLVLAGFMIWETPAIPIRLRRLSAKTGESLDFLRTAVVAVHRYLYVKSVASVLTGFLAGMLCWILGVDTPVVWGGLAFVLNYIPNVGSFVAGIPPVVVAFLEHGVPGAIAVTVGYLVINLVVGNILEPKMTGDAVRLSPVVVLLSLVFWGWALGPVGALLSVPLTVIVRIVAVRSVSFSWVSVLLEPASTLMDPEELEVASGSQAVDGRAASPSRKREVGAILRSGENSATS